MCSRPRRSPCVQVPRATPIGRPPGRPRPPRGRPRARYDADRRRARRARRAAGPARPGRPEPSPGDTAGRRRRCPRRRGRRHRPDPPALDSRHRGPAARSPAAPSATAPRRDPGGVSPGATGRPPPLALEAPAPPTGVAAGQPRGPARGRGAREAPDAARAPAPPPLQAPSPVAAASARSSRRRRAAAGPRATRAPAHVRLPPRGRPRPPPRRHAPRPTAGVAPATRAPSPLRVAPSPGGFPVHASAAAPHRASAPPPPAAPAPRRGAGPRPSCRRGDRRAARAPSRRPARTRPSPASPTARSPARATALIVGGVVVVVVAVVLVLARGGGIERAKDAAKCASATTTDAAHMPHKHARARTRRTPRRRRVPAETPWRCSTARKPTGSPIASSTSLQQSGYSQATALNGSPPGCQPDHGRRVRHGPPRRRAGRGERAQTSRRCSRWKRPRRRSRARATVVVIAGLDKAAAVGKRRPPGEQRNNSSRSANAALDRVDRLPRGSVLPRHPERSAKPRERGLTHVIDRGLSIAEVDGLLEVAGDERGHRQARLGHRARERQPEAQARALCGARHPGGARRHPHRARDPPGPRRGADRMAARAGAAPRRGLRRHDRAGGRGQEPSDPHARRERVHGALGGRQQGRRLHHGAVRVGGADRTRPAGGRVEGDRRGARVGHGGHLPRRRRGAHGPDRRDRARDRRRAADLRGAPARAAGMAAAQASAPSATSATSPRPTCSRWRRCGSACARTRSSGSRWAAAIERRAPTGRRPDGRSR